MDIYTFSYTIFLGQLNESHDVWLLDATQYGNCRVLKINMSISYRNSIVRCVIVEYHATQNFYNIKNKYKQVHIRTL